MKTKLLKKLRKNYKVLINLNGDSIVKKKVLYFLWIDVSDSKYWKYWCEKYLASYKGSYILYLFKCKYHKYTRRYKIEKIKNNTWIKIWYSNV